MKTHLIFFCSIISCLACEEATRNASGDGGDGPGEGPNYTTQGNQIIGPDGQPVRFNGINWYGFEDAEMMVHGLNRRSLDAYLDQIAQLGFDLIRLPFSNEMLDMQTDPLPADSVVYELNPELAGLTPYEKFKVFISKAGERGIKILLDRHRPAAAEQSDLWYTDAYPEADWISDWLMLARDLRSHTNIIGADLHNEPGGYSTWGTEEETRDWHLAAQRAGNAILAEEPRWLIIVEGGEKNIPNVIGYYWRGGNLKGVRDYPVELNVPNKLVYSAHDYGPEIADMPWFSDAAYPNNLPAVWDEHWGYIHKEGIAPVLVGEFGAKNVQPTSASGMWFNALVNYINENDLYWAFWTFNPDSGDTGGLLGNDWETVNQDKMTALQQLF